MDQIEYVNLEKKKPQANQNKQRRRQNIRPNKNETNRRNQRDNQPFKNQRKQWRNKDQQRQNRPFQSENRIVATGKRRRQLQTRKFNQRPKAPRNIQPNVIIKGLDPKMTEAGLQEACKDFGPMNMCKLDRDNFGQVKPEGIGLIRFTRVEDAKACVEKLDGVTVQIIGENNNEKVISATFVGDSEQADNNRNRGVLNITKRSINKRNWRR
ncbi:unnamed protein product (macronuclear) [Paramecium tetraurelia]|uniref:RRM domain-containing protein n=1 Tax=Paramecium tetraurelia TaxID=5888 RepID=A0CTF7_PARTE|nr:uncharacterized protein GSPATT00010308001 [Paramecium tetraurelia]CAK74074.1 unnamed protein product [Paramecium tetraurelia]|eukprot:XP_001441471.1 hypothetical protein (macronuclear) [Paramecium tetraurelia strain d4-2]